MRIRTIRRLCALIEKRGNHIPHSASYPVTTEYLLRSHYGTLQRRHNLAREKQKNAVDRRQYGTRWGSTKTNCERINESKPNEKRE